VTTVLIIGSGPAAAGAALALSAREGVAVTVIDIGERLDVEGQHAVERLAAAEPALWEPALVERVSAQPVSSGLRGVPEKRTYGSDYPFRNVGQLDGLTADEDATTSLISAAYGGYSNVWGSQLMPFTTSAFDNWPVDAAEMSAHYKAVLDEIPYAGEVDDLAENFPLLHRADPLPPLSDRSRRVLDAYDRHRPALQARGITMGKARLAFRARDCVRCRLCMTGCPYGLIYSAAQTFDALQRSGRVTLHHGLMALRISEEADTASVVAQELATGRTHRFEADRIFIACGALGTTRLVANSLNFFDVDLPILESQQFILPMLSLRASVDPRYEPDFTLNQFNMLVAPDGDSADMAQLHFYTFNPSFIDSLPSLLRGDRMGKVQAHLLRRLSVTLGYLPSWRSPRLLARVRKSSGNRGLPDMHISRDSAPDGRNQMLRSVVARLVRSAPQLDLYPVLPMLRLAAGGKSYHVGGSFPHSAGPSGGLTSDRLGRVTPWQRVHLIDASVFPTIPAMTFTLTIMANAHRIACETMELAA
jgi:choline dehydrogenase-like flavoprotein